MNPRLFPSCLLTFVVFIKESKAVALPSKKLPQVSLLHQSEGIFTTATGTSGSEAKPEKPGSERSHSVNPQPEGHLLTNSELKSVQSVRCLEAKQIDPSVNCSDTKRMQGRMPAGALNAGNYPMWSDPRCNSNGAFFCDPDRLLTPQQRASVTAEMKTMREKHLITCGPQLQHDPIEKWNYQPLYLGVAIAKGWPLDESDAESLQTFGQILAGRWNMTMPWNGNPAFYSRCPNEAMLIVLPDKNQAILSSPSCMFICEDKGAPEVSLATVAGMESGNLTAGISAGISQVYNIIAQSSPMHKSGWEPTEKNAGTWLPWSSKFKQAAAKTDSSSDFDQGFWEWSQRIVFALSVILLGGSLLVAFLVCYLAPGLARDLNKNGDSNDPYRGLLTRKFAV